MSSQLAVPCLNRTSITNIQTLHSLSHAHTYTDICSVLSPSHTHTHPPSPLLGFHSLSIPCLISSVRASSVKDPVMLKLQRGLTSKNVTFNLSAYSWACSVVT